jgi:energy-converting hydrogenase Eha subunit A
MNDLNSLLSIDQHYKIARMIARPSSLLVCLLLVLSVVQAVKFQLPSERNPKPSASFPTFMIAELMV